MPTFHIETNQGAFEIDADREPTEADIQHLVSSGQLKAASAPQQPEFHPRRQLTADFSPIYSNRDETAARNAGFDGVVGTVLPAAASLGGPVAGGIAGTVGESLVQARRTLNHEQPSFNTGEVVKSGIVNSVPMGKAKGIYATIKNAMRFGAAGAAGEEARSLIDDGQAASAGDLAVSGGVPAAVTLAAPVVGKAVGALTGNVGAEEAVRVAKINQDMKAKLANAADLINSGGALPPAELGDKSLKNFIGQQFAGKEHLQQQSSLRNEPVLRGKVRADLDMPSDGPMNADTIEAAQTRAMKPYEQVAALSDNAAKDFESLKVSRGKLRELNDTYKANKGQDPTLLDQIRAEKEKVSGLEDMMEAHAEAATNPKLADWIDKHAAAASEAQSIADKFNAEEAARKAQSGMPNYQERSISEIPFGPGNYGPDSELAAAYDKAQKVADGYMRRIEGRAVPSGAMPGDAPELIQDMRQGRTVYAKSMQLQDADAINYGRHELKPQSLANAYEVRNGKANMSGGMQRAAEISQAFPRETQQTAAIGTPGVSRLNGMAAGQAIASGDGMKGLTTATVPFLGPIIRNHMLSKEVQQAMLARLQKGVSPSTEADPRLVELITRAVTAQARGSQRK